MEIHKTIRAKSKEFKAQQRKQQQEEQKAKDYNLNALKRLLKDSNEPKSKRAVQLVRDNLNAFGSFEMIKETINALDSTDPIERAFQKEFKDVFKAENPSRKYLNWCNYTTYTRASLITAIFCKWFSGSYKQPTVTRITKKKVLVSSGLTPTGKQAKSKKFKTVERKRTVKISNTRNLIENLAKRRDIMNPKITTKDQHKDYGILRTYAFKLLNMLVSVDENGEKHRERRNSSYTESRAIKSRIESLSKRREKLKSTNKFNIDMDWIQQKLMEKKQYYPYVTAETPKDTQKQMSLLAEVLRSKTIKPIYEMAKNGDVVQERILLQRVVKNHERRLRKAGYVSA